MPLTMKFRHRMFVLASIGTVAVIYLVWTTVEHLTRRSHSDLVDEFMRENPVKFTYEQQEATPGQCQARFIVPRGVVSTQDLADRTDFTNEGGEYPLKHGAVEDVAYGWNLEPLTVIIVPHSHVDPGWLDTVDEYYQAKVKDILNGMVTKLHEHKDMTFIWAEVVFFSRWWADIQRPVQLQVLDLIKQGRLELVLGGWVMPDEASTHYVSLISQLVEGHQWLAENLGITPNVSWSIDPFGHSGTMPYLWKQAGMTDMVIQRIHQGLKGQMIKEKSLEFHWRQYWDRAGNTDIFCHVMPYMLYSLHQTCGPDKYTCSLFDFRKLSGEMNAVFVKPITADTLAKKAKLLFEQYRLKGSIFRHNTILVPLGDDFRYDKLQEWDQQYENYKKLMDYMNSVKEWKMNVKFGTISDFFNGLHATERNRNLRFPNLSGDFFPYSDHDNTYWTGYFTTRPFDKRFARETESRLRAAEVLYSIALSYSSYWNGKISGLEEVPELLETARRNLAVFLHHDAITGTAKAHVVEDYENMLFESYEAAATVLGRAAQYLLTKGQIDAQPPVLVPELARINGKTSSMHKRISPSVEGMSLLLYNPTGHFRSEFVEVIVDTFQLDIVDSSGKSLPFQINPVYSSVTEVDRESFEIIFLSEIQGFAMELYTFKKTLKTPKSVWSKITVYNTNEFIVAPELLFIQEMPKKGNKKEFIYFENDNIGAKFKTSNGLLTKILDKSENRTRWLDAVLEFKQYLSRGSGAYIFFPLESASDYLPGTPIVRVVEGPFSSEVQTVYKNLYHRVKLYKHPGIQGKFLFVQNTLDMFYLNMRDKEPIMRLSTNVGNHPGNFFTDENGFQFIGRKRHPSDPELFRIERNYYPLTTMAFIQDSLTRVTLHAGQSLGVASLGRGELEVMLDRQLLYDDERGLGEGIGDNKLTMTKFMIQVEDSSQVMKEDKFTYPSLQAILMNEFLNQPLQKMYSLQINKEMSSSFTPLKHPLPCEVFVVTIKSLFTSDHQYNGTGFIMHRRGFRCGYPTGGTYCSQTDVDLSGLFPGIDSSQVRETTLTHTSNLRSNVDLSHLDIPIMELKSYVVNVKPFG